jgi:hypothetical protein
MNLILSASKKLETAIKTYLTAGIFSLGTVTADAGTNVLTTATAHGLAVGDRVRFTNSGGALPGGITAGTNFFVLTAPTSTTLTLSATDGGPVLDITSTGTGTHTIYYRPQLVEWAAPNEICTLYEGETSGTRSDPFHVVISAGPEGGPLYDRGMYDVLLSLDIWRIAKVQHGETVTPVQQKNDAVETLDWIFSRERNVYVKAALEAIDPTLVVTGYWPEPRQDTGTQVAFAITLPLNFHVCNA